jgi:hypothetical protein
MPAIQALKTPDPIRVTGRNPAADSKARALL